MWAVKTKTKEKIFQSCMHLIFEILNATVIFFRSFFTTNSISLTTEWIEFVIWLIFRIFFFRLRIFQIHCIVEFLDEINNFWIDINISIRIFYIRHVFRDNCHHRDRSGARNFDFKEWMRMRYCCFTFWTKIEIFANAALVSITIDWSLLTSITLDTCMYS